MVEECDIVVVESDMKVCSARQALKLLRKEFKTVARAFSNGNWADEEDLLHDMYTAVLECEDGRRLRFYRVTGVNRAKDTLRYNELREMTSIESYEEPDNVPELQYRCKQQNHDAILDSIDRLTRHEPTRKPRRIGG